MHRIAILAAARFHRRQERIRSGPTPRVNAAGGLRRATGHCLAARPLRSHAGDR